MSLPIQPLNDAEWEEKCALETIPRLGTPLTTAQTERLDELQKRSKVPLPPPPGTLPRAIKIPKMTEMLAGDPGVGGAVA